MDFYDSYEDGSETFEELQERVLVTEDAFEATEMALCFSSEVDIERVYRKIESEGCARAAITLVDSFPNVDEARMQELVLSYGYGFDIGLFSTVADNPDLMRCAQAIANHPEENDGSSLALLFKNFPKFFSADKIAELNAGVAL